MAKKLLIVLTSHDRLGDTGRKTGFYYEEMAVPYWIFRDAGLEVDIASVRGGHAPHDPASLEDAEEVPEAVRRFRDDEAAMRQIENSLPIDSVDPLDYDAVYLPGGHGTMWDLPDCRPLRTVIETAGRQGAVVAAVCHGPAGLIGATAPDGRPLVAGRRINAFTDEEEKAMELDGVVPFLLESRLRSLGAAFEKSGPMESHVVRDGRLITGQNPASSKAIGQAVLDALRE
ncbi:type 1 glutamine amidotransferase domain-containing protein [Marinimicrococcus flavescens]|uniref:Type 1 glutamine amidotransferase domain-containing protein n=1 Tax=Marinimicrococcus flavescens TaxID=3031815 RepID=A0AAP3V285_9PROT|nr:type 1 glutamine amidotransferase domain-containing protein [Marinimicrococcus flavescens]